jgi:hypothetical protein
MSGISSYRLPKKYWLMIRENSIPKQLNCYAIISMYMILVVYEAYKKLYNYNKMLCRC